MSKGLEEYLKRCSTDAEFRALEEADFDAAVAEYDLDENEKQELRDYLQSDRHRAIEGTAMRAFEEIVSSRTGEPSAEEMKLIEERERRNLAAMLAHPADADHRAEFLENDTLPAGLTSDVVTCLMCDQPKPWFSWLKGWRRGLCSTHRNVSPFELMTKIESDMEKTMKWLKDRYG